MSKTRILVVDDEPETVKFVASNLRLHGNEVLGASDGYTALRLFHEEMVDLVILDISLPDLDGFQVCQAIRRESNAPIIVLSANRQERDIVRALDMGADDYLTKPFGVDELMARVRMALRHGPSSSTTHRPTLTIQGMTIDFDARKVTVEEQVVELTRIEFDLIAHLALNAGRVLTHRTLLQNVWGPEYSDETEYLWTYIKRLRQKIEPDPRNPRYILTQAGVGYFCVSPT
jgi:two-component system KDP operon response regulator KdpE